MNIFWSWTDPGKPRVTGGGHDEVLNDRIRVLKKPSRHSEKVAVTAYPEHFGQQTRRHRPNE
jgi:hypothetical protein